MDSEETRPGQLDTHKAGGSADVQQLVDQGHGWKRRNMLKVRQDGAFESYDSLLVTSKSHVSHLNSSTDLSRSQETFLVKVMKRNQEAVDLTTSDFIQTTERWAFTSSWTHRLCVHGGQWSLCAGHEHGDWKKKKPV